MKKRTIGVILSATVSSLLIAAPSYGFSINDFINSIVDDLLGEVSSISTWAKEEINNSWGEIKENANAAIDASIGQLGAPDPMASSQKLKDSLKDDYSYPVAQENAQALERELTLGSVASVIGEKGQEQTQEKIDTTSQIAQQASSLAEEAQNMDASQDILKAIASQNGLIVGMLAEQRTDSLLARQDTSYSNLMLTQVADHLDSQRQKEIIEKEGTLSLFHELALNAVLDPAYSE
ncbi:MAG TPA: hypothetical protein VK203_25215 [Nostocaceae cyanobacterium]|nr:hypothetical protein [Nostocaceae cyanobacterium]